MILPHPARRERVHRRVAALYDVHGNLPALEAALRAVDAWGADSIVVGGDVVLGPMPRECLALLTGYSRARVHYISGNCDRLVVAAGEGRLDAEPGAERLPPPVRSAIVWVAEMLTREERAICEQWPASVTLAVEELGAVHFCHATPRSDDELLTEDTPEPLATAMVAGSAHRVIVCGHTHMQFDRRVGDGVRLVNAGSVGMPYGTAGAHWLRIDSGVVSFEQTPYNLETAAARVGATAYPGAAEFAATAILNPPSAAAMRSAFERARAAPASLS